MFVKATSQHTARFFLSHLCILCQRAPWLVASENPGLRCYRIIHYYIGVSVHEAAEDSEIHSFWWKVKSFAKKTKNTPCWLPRIIQKKKKKSIVRVIKINSSAVKSALPDLKGPGTYRDKNHRSAVLEMPKMHLKPDQLQIFCCGCTQSGGNSHREATSRDFGLFHGSTIYLP